MNIFLISEYIRRLNIEDVADYAQKEGINLTNDELQTIYYHIKNDYKEFLTKDPTPILKQVQTEVKPQTYNKIIELYEKYKDKI